MNTRAIFAIVRKDLKVALQNKGVVLPIVILPLVLFVIFPWVMVYASSMADMTGSSMSNVDELLARMPSGLLNELSGYTQDQQMIVFSLVYMLAPMFLILPLMVSSVLAADSFAGEKERKTLEALLYTPTTDRELFTAKLLGAWTAAVAVALFSFVIYAVMVNAAGWQSIRHIFFPNWMWIALVFWVTPAVAGLGLVVMVFRLRSRTGLSGCLSNRWPGGLTGISSDDWADFRRDVFQPWRCLVCGSGNLVDRCRFTMVCQQRLPPWRVDDEVLNDLNDHLTSDWNMIHLAKLKPILSTSHKLSQ
jgi:ABC-2 type transport system permease protein